jgi:hypothetical protein
MMECFSGLLPALAEVPLHGDIQTKFRNEHEHRACCTVYPMPRQRSRWSYIAACAISKVEGRSQMFVVKMPSELLMENEDSCDAAAGANELRFQYVPFDNDIS